VSFINHGFHLVTMNTLFRLATLTLLLSATLVNNVRGEEPLSFNRDVRPILASQCFACHGPDGKHREADLRLDTREGATQSAVVPGKPTESELVKRILSSDADEIMPPPKTKKKLSEQEKQILQKWIVQGAPYEGHWAFMPVANPAPPAVQQTAWPQNAIDHFVLAELEKRKITPSPAANKTTLLRRLSLDLIGLPPTPEEVQAFLADESPQAYAKVVERLLASPHYGERWGRHWLDQARYADSSGYTIDSERTMWPYRDWVIQALNSDMPFDQFTREQLAGDLLPNATKQQRLATAFHRNTMINEEGGTDAEQFRNEIVVDRVNTTGAVWLGLTLGCAQCHSHKFDPISHREYYELFAFFNQGTDVNNRGETINILPGDVLGNPLPEAVTLQVAEAAKKKFESLKKDQSQRQTAWEARLAQSESAPNWQRLELESYTAESNRSLTKLDDGSILAMKEGASDDTYEIVGSTTLSKIAAVRLEVLPHESLPKNGPGTAGNGNFVLSELEVSIDGKPAKLLNALADHEKKDYAVAAAIDGKLNTGWALERSNGNQNPGAHEAWFIFADPQPAGKINIQLKQHINDHYLIGHFALSVVEQIPDVPPQKKEREQVIAAAKKEAGKRSKAETLLLTNTFAQVDHAFAAAARESEHTTQKSAGSATVMVMREIEQPRETFLHLRGDFLNLDKQHGALSPDTPDCLPPLQAAGKRVTRLDLANWLVRTDHPLTPRVAVNRMWMRYFGQGLVETENDFGTQGSVPTHPALLDYLAYQFMHEGWSLKKLHRLIVLSATYQQSSHDRPELRQVDPQNLLLARQQRIRFDAEILRDAALSATGLLNPTLGGPTTRPPQPAGVYAFTQNNKPWKESAGGDRYRRALYTTFIRSAPHPLFTTFDAPSFSSVCTRRPRSNTPLQSLMLANDPAFLEFAQALAVQLWKQHPQTGEAFDRDRVRLAFTRCLSRDPTEKEATITLAYLQKQRDLFARDAGAAKQAASGNWPATVPTAEAAAWCAVCRAIMNTDEFITRE
jgi:Protein of unknown function (DUF1549)/Protein of unknown function (DUF1553)/Planctomycete cytochrome C